MLKQLTSSSKRTRRNQRRRETRVGSQIEVLQSRELLSATNLSEVVLLDGETSDPAGPLLNRFGGGTVNGINATTGFEATTVRTGDGALRIQTNGTIAAGEFDFTALALTGFGPSNSYVDTRDLTGFDEVRFWLRNETGSPFQLVFEVKDYRDSNDHRGRLSFAVSDSTDWTEIVVPLDLTTAGWTVFGSPDLSRARIFSLVIEAQAVPVSGSLFVDDMILVESGGTLNPTSASADQLLERVVARQFRGLWGSRDRDTGLIPSISSFADVMALNSTSGVVQMLPEAIRRGLVSQGEADAGVAQIVATMQTVWDNVEAGGNGGFLPPRYIDRVNLNQSFVLEESSVDASFFFLALHQYRNLPTTTTTLRDNIDALLNRFDFDAFNSPTGWRLAYLYQSQTFTTGTYDGYSGEVYAISLAAHLAPSNQVDITTHWNSATFRVSDFLVDENDSHLVHSQDAFRAPFLQWLFHLFADVSQRGTDSYSDPMTGSTELATNPVDNALRYQRETHRALQQLNRNSFLQPDAGDDGTGGTYEQFSLYNNFGQPNLFMPWSVGFSVLGDPAFALPALREMLRKDLHGPLGLTDSAVFATGAATPTRQTARHDFWNLALSTMSLMTATSSSPSNTAYAQNADVSAALDSVFPNPILTLPDGGGTYLVQRDGADLTVRIQNGAELFRGVASNLVSLTIEGSGDADNVTVLVEGGTGNQVNTALRFDGGDSDDRFLGQLATGPMTLLGGAGNDELVGGPNDDNLSGNAGNDTIRGNAGNDMATGGDGQDVIFAGNGRDNVTGDGGVDRLFGDNGYDTISGGSGNDFIRGGRGNDRLNGDTGNDAIIGDLHNDTLTGDTGNDTLSGGDGNDRIFAGNGLDVIEGGSGDDRLFGDNGYDSISGGAGNDVIRGGRGNDLLFGDAGNDQLFGDLHNDRLFGGDDDDTLRGGDGDDSLNGGDGSDLADGEAGADTIDVQEAPQPDGIDSVVSGDAADTIFADPNDVFI
jgi:Ca2+-binding RTX toxin-like protein